MCMLSFLPSLTTVPPPVFSSLTTSESLLGRSAAKVAEEFISCFCPPPSNFMAVVISALAALEAW